MADPNKTNPATTDGVLVVPPKKTAKSKAKAKPVKHAYGWVKGTPDPRDCAVAPVAYPLKGTAPVFSLKDNFKFPVFNQEQLGACTGNGAAEVVEYVEQQQGNSDTPFSRLFIYYNERVVEGTVPTDSGAQIRTAIKVLAAQGAPPETLWPYSDKNPGPFQEKPSEEAFEAAVKHVAVKYQSVPQNLVTFKEQLVAGNPIIFGFTVYEQFESEEAAKTGIISVPKPDEAVVGGHCVVAVGWDDTKESMICRNSWGEEWGDEGYFYLPYKYITNASLASDFWIVTQES